MCLQLINEERSDLIFFNICKRKEHKTLDPQEGLILKLLPQLKLWHFVKETIHG